MSLLGLGYFRSGAWVFVLPKIQMMEAVSEFAS